MNAPEDKIAPVCPEIAAGDFEAVIIDLDGVVADTAGRHAGAPVNEPSVKLLQRLKAEGIALAVVSSSRDCGAILEAAGIGALFDISIDGVVAAERDLRGKPEPDRVLAAAELLGCPPARAVVIEDALAGVAAGRRGGFGLVIGVDRTAHGDALRRAGADLVVADLAAVAVRPLPSALSHWREIVDRIADRRPVVFLDYDGTLTPIVDRPELAVMDDESRATVRALADRVAVAVVSGRDAADVRALVGLADVIYCGSHGFEIIGPDSLERRHAAGLAFLPAIDKAERALHAALAGIDGLLIERKGFSVAVHYRLVAEANVAAVFEAVDRAAAAHPELRKMAGKKVVELRPDLDWDKGRAIFWLLETLGLDHAAVAPIYLGDDLTDEDAFRALRQRATGIGIVVGERPRRTAAQYWLAGPGDVLEFLRLLAQLGGQFGGQFGGQRR